MGDVAVLRGDHWREPNPHFAHEDLVPYSHHGVYVSVGRDLLNNDFHKLLPFLKSGSQSH